MKKTKWLIYTVIIGMIPFLVRTFIYIFSKSSTWEFWINEGDIIAFGLALNLTNLNELEDQAHVDKEWKAWKIGLSVVQILIYTSIFAVVNYSDLRNDKDLNRSLLKICSLILAFGTFLFSYSIYNRLNTISK